MIPQELLPGLDVAQNVHPILVHLPLGLWPTALLFFLLGTFTRSDRLVEVGRWLLYLASLAAIVSAVSGWIGANDLGHDTSGHDLVHIHRNWMIAATVLSVATSILAFALRESRSAARWLVVAALGVSLAVATLGADRGAYLVYGKGVGTTIQPDAPESGEDHEDGGHGHSH